MQAGEIKKPKRDRLFTACLDFVLCKGGLWTEEELLEMIGVELQEEKPLKEISTELVKLADEARKKYILWF
jgi:hypothetical protein